MRLIRAALDQTRSCSSAGAGREQAAKHAEGGGLARPVGAQQAEDLTPAYREIRTLGRHEVTEAPHQTAYPDHLRVALGGDPDTRGGGGGGRFVCIPEQVDESIFKAWWDLLQLNVRGIQVRQQQGRLGRCSRGGDQSNPAAVDNRVHYLC